MKQKACFSVVDCLPVAIVNLLSRVVLSDRLHFVKVTIDQFSKWPWR